MQQEIETEVLSKEGLNRIFESLDRHKSAERKKYIQVWKQEGYRKRSPAEDQGVLAFKTEVLRTYASKDHSLLDVGCGTGRAGLELNKIYKRVTMVDIAPDCLDPYVRSMLTDQFTFINCAAWELAERSDVHDWLFCCDLMEHLPTETVDYALAAMSLVVKRGGLFQIYTEPHKYDKLNNIDLHLTVKPCKWWLEKVSEFFEVLKFKEESERVTIIIGKPNNGS